MMPDLDGFELTRRLRAEQRTQHIPILMLTARGDSKIESKDSSPGVNAYLPKPFFSKELPHTVRSLLNVQQTTANLVLVQRMDSLQSVAGGLAHENQQSAQLSEELGAACALGRARVACSFPLMRLQRQLTPPELDRPPIPERSNLADVRYR